MDCTICVAKTKALISFVVTAKLICVFVFAYAKSRFSHDEAHIKLVFSPWVKDTQKFYFCQFSINIFVDGAISNSPLQNSFLWKKY